MSDSQVYQGSKERNKEALAKLREAVVTLKRCRPSDRSDMDRWYQIIITDVEKATGAFKTHVVEGG